MRELKHHDTVRPWPHNNMVRPKDDRAPRRSKLAAGGALALVFAALFVAALFVMVLFQAPQIAWTFGLAAGLIMLAVAIAFGFRQWARGRTKYGIGHQVVTPARRASASSSGVA